MASGYKRDPIWEYFEEIPSLGKKEKRIKCKQRKKEMQGLVARMKHHNENCLLGENDVHEDVDMSEEQQLMLINWLIWDAVDTGRCLKTYSCHSCAVRAAQWSLCGRRILSGGFDFMLHLTDVETGVEDLFLLLYKGAQVFTSKNEYRISTLKFHPSDPNIFICGGFGPEVKAWDIRNCKVIKVYKAAVQQTLDVLFLPEGKEFLTSTDAVSRDSADRTIIAWDFHSAAKISNQIFHERYTCPSLTLHPKESTFVAQTNGNYMALFSTQRPYRINKKKRYEGHKVEGFAVDCEFSPDGALLLTGSSEGKVFFYNYHTARIIHTLSAHDQACVSATFHPVLPSLLATCDWAGEIKVWQ
ncbi:WD repeat-containing protein 25-like [Alligator sinensis]|uniref:WD repeat-containing protein 25-like n=1 Tax=Alligator sinensis TaxID=38654 RepID=A0A3Q0FTA3_ALLSI|nr:WD repeat-containing protein 25-like [Alligator sinensis]